MEAGNYNKDNEKTQQFLFWGIRRRNSPLLFLMTMMGRDVVPYAILVLHPAVNVCRREDETLTA